jgi:hypothetical protein
MTPAEQLRELPVRIALGSRIRYRHERTNRIRTAAVCRIGETGVAVRDMRAILVFVPWGRITEICNDQ